MYLFKKKLKLCHFERTEVGIVGGVREKSYTICKNVKT
jgi:hypothetical protein